MDQQSGYEVELTAGREEVAAALNGVADGVRSGGVRLGAGSDAVSFAVPDELSLEIELESEDGETSLELELEWPTSDDDAVSPVERSPEAVGGEAGEIDGAVEAGEVGEAGEAGSGREVGEVGEAEEAGDDRRTDEGEADAVAAATDGSESLARFELYQDRGAEWRWRLRHRNGNIIATSGEGYTRKHNAVKGVRSVMNNSSGASVTDAFTDGQ